MDDTAAPEKIIDQFDRALNELLEAPAFARDNYAPKLMSAVHRLAETPEGFEYLYERIGDITRAGIFKGSTWEDPKSLVPTLVGGTLKVGGESTNYELLSELRMVSIAKGDLTHEDCSREDARDFMQQVLANNLDFLFPDGSEEARKVEPELWVKITNLFKLLVQEIPFDGIKPNLLEEIEMICAQRPIITDRVRKIMHFISDRLDLDPEQEVDHKLQQYLNAVYKPTDFLQEFPDMTQQQYRENLKDFSKNELQSECRDMGDSLLDTGLASPYHVTIIQEMADNPARLKEVLALSKSGRAELDLHTKFVQELIKKIITPATYRCIYGLGRLLDRNLLSHQPVLSGIKRLLTVDLHPTVKENILRSTIARNEDRPDPNGLLVADTISVLGQPLGVGQGWNPTCQSARGISLWSSHAPGKLLRMIITAATENNLSMRFEGVVLNSSELTLGLAKEFDYHLDIVSIVLVPHLDKIYNDMMRRCGLRADDGHKWVNPAMYGQWIPTGFISAYDVTTHAIKEYEQFVQTFYATHHPKFNGGHDLAYPNPVGMFITSATGKLLGFHAVSILRVADHGGQMRVYFLNPNNEGRQIWGPDIEPTVAGNGERHGESSLPFYQFASRIYAFHYSEADLDELSVVDNDRVKRVVDIARQSWGESYTWL